MMKKILITGKGGREHALAWSFAQDPAVTKVYIAPGNGGTALEDKCTNVPSSNTQDLLEFARAEKIDLTFVGSEDLLAEGIVDLFQKHNLKIFGPTKEQAQLESNKNFAKLFMQRYRVKTPRYLAFDNPKAAFEHIAALTAQDFPVVVKASGLAAGKGVIIASNQPEANSAINRLMIEKTFGKAGDLVLIEEYLSGFECSILALCDGKTILPLPSAKDHKRIGVGEVGENTGGMGVVAPNPLFSEQHQQKFIDSVLLPTLAGIKDQKWNLTAVIFFGLMVAKDEVYLLEYNMRLGDPEAQTLLPMLKEPFSQLVESACQKNLKNTKVTAKKGYACCVVSASAGYPREYKTGEQIQWPDRADNFSKKFSDQKIFIAGAQLKNDHLYTSGGRVLNSVAIADTLDLARQKSLSQLNKAQFSNQYFRNDIGAITKDR